MPFVGDATMACRQLENLVGESRRRILQVRMILEPAETLAERDLLRRTRVLIRKEEHPVFPKQCFNGSKLLLRQSSQPKSAHFGAEGSGQTLYFEIRVLRHERPPCDRHARSMPCGIDQSLSREWYASRMSKPFALEEAGLARLSHVSIQVADLPLALAFYTDVLGFQVVLERTLEGPEFEAVTATPGARSKLIRGLVAGNSVVQLFWHNWREPQLEKRTLMSFEVRDAYIAHERLVKAGVDCQSEPVPFDNSHAFVIHDPDGHPIEIIQWKADAAPYRASSA